MFRTLLTQGRKLDSLTPRPSLLGSHLGRIGFLLIGAVRAVGARPDHDLDRLDVLVKSRNAIVHGSIPRPRGATTMGATQLTHGDEVIIPWGIDEIHGTVRDVYGTPPRVHVVVELTPELSGSIVDEPTTAARHQCHGEGRRGQMT